jgi:quinol monooxygenase YgiN
MIYVVATVQVAPGRRADVLAEFQALVPLVRAEKGCLEYGPTIDVATGIPAQGAPRDDSFTVVERWEDLDSLQAHLMAPHMLAYRGKVKGLVLGTTLQVLEPV